MVYQEKINEINTTLVGLSKQAVGDKGTYGSRYDDDRQTAFTQGSNV